MIGYLVGHRGADRTWRAAVLAARLAGRGEPVTLLGSTPPRPPRPGPAVGWVALPRDDDPVPGPADDVSAHGRLGWAPRAHPGLRARAAALSAWVADVAPAVLVSDGSPEAALLARLHGVPVVSVVDAGNQTGPGDALGLEVSDLAVGLWPAGAGLARLPAGVTGRLREVGALSRYDDLPAAVPAARAPAEDGGGPRVTLVGDRGREGWRETDLAAVRAALPGWRVTVLGAGGTWTADPWAALRRSDVVVTHAGEEVLAHVAAAEVPAVVVTGPRGEDARRAVADVLHHGPWPVRARETLRHDDWPGLLAEVAALDGDAWSGWGDGGAADRFADAVGEVVPAVREGARSARGARLG